MKTITATELKKRMDAGETIHLIDVREPHEHLEFNIGGILIPLGNIQSMQLDELEELKEEEVISYCRSGGRSGQACMILEAAGFKNVVNLTGGILGWRDTFNV